MFYFHFSLFSHSEIFMAEGYNISCRKLYVVLSVLVCLLACSLVTFFMFPRPVLVEDGGIRSVLVYFDHTNGRVLINMTVSGESCTGSGQAWWYCKMCVSSQSCLKFNNRNFFVVLVNSVNSQILYMKTVIGTQQLDNVISIQPLSQIQVSRSSSSFSSAPPITYNTDTVIVCVCRWILLSVWRLVVLSPMCSKYLMYLSIHVWTCV